MEPTVLQMRMLEGLMRLGPLEEIGCFFSHHRGKYVLMMKYADRSASKLVQMQEEVDSLDDLERAGGVLRRRMDEHFASGASN